MSISRAQFFVAAAQGQAQLVLQLLKVRKFLLDIGQLFFQSTPHRRARLQAGSSQTQESTDLAEFESQALYAADKSQRIDVVLRVLTEASLSPRGPRQQSVALIEPNRVNAEADPFRHDANLHDPCSSL